MKRTLLFLFFAFAFIFTGCDKLAEAFNMNLEPSIDDLAIYLVEIDDSDVTQNIESIELSDGEWECSLEGMNSWHTYEIKYAKFKVQGPNITYIDGMDVWRDGDVNVNLFIEQNQNGYTVTKKGRIYTGTKTGAALVNFVKTHVIGSKSDWDSSKTNSDKTKFICTDTRLSTKETLIVKKIADSTEPVKEYNPADYKNPVPEDAIAIFNPHDFTDYNLPDNFSCIAQDYVIQIEDDETYGKVMHFNRVGKFPSTWAEFRLSDVNLKDKTLYMVIKGKSNSDNSDYSDLKVMVTNGSGSSETYNFIPKDDTKYVTYSASNNYFWGTYNKTAVSDWTSFGYLQFDFQYADFDMKIAAIYYK